MMKNNFKKIPSVHVAWQQQGFTLIELMIALLIGLIVIAAAAGMFLSNSRVYGTTESVGRIQENTRAAFEIMSRDIREAGVTACGRSDTLMGTHAFLPEIQAGVWVNGNALDIYLSNNAISNVIEHIDPAGPLRIAPAAGAAYAGDEMMAICNSDFNVLFSATTAAGGILTPTAPLSNSQGAELCFLKPASGSWSSSCDLTGASSAYVGKVLRHRWEVRSNGRGGSSLYRQLSYPNTAGNMQNLGAAEEIAENVNEMRLAFRRSGDSAFQDNFSSWTAEDWKKVVSVQVTLVFQGDETGNAAGTDNAPLTRTMATATAMRNREDLL